MGAVYIVTNTCNGKQYCGRTKRTAALRWRDHCLAATGGHSNTKFHKAIRKYGVEAFSVREIFINSDDTLLSAIECLAIAVLNTNSTSGYNMSDGGDGTSGVVVTQNTRDKMRRSALGKQIKPATRAKLSKALRGLKRPFRPKRPMSDVTKDKIRSKALERGARPPGTLGRMMSDETKVRIGDKKRLRYDAARTQLVNHVWSAIFDVYGLSGA